MSNFEKIIPLVLKSEGGFVDNMNDSGGATNFGISLKFLKSIDISESDFNNDDAVDYEDVKCMNVEDAKHLYKKYFWNLCGLEAFNGCIQLQYAFFDACVNCGYKAAVKLLQRTLNKFFKLKVDGVLGDKTFAAYEMIVDKRQLADDFMHERAKFYKNLCEVKPKLKVFYSGWLNRCKHVTDNFNALG